jgi:hypothetical protein
MVMVAKVQPSKFNGFEARREHNNGFCNILINLS